MLIKTNNYKKLGDSACQEEGFFFEQVYLKFYVSSGTFSNPRPPEVQDKEGETISSSGSA